MDNSSTGRREESAASVPQRKRSAKKKKKRSVWRVILGFFKVMFTLLLIGALTASMFAWIFMTYVKTSLAPDLEVDLNSFTMNLSSTILYEDKNGNWVEMQSLYGDENRIWVDYENIPKYVCDAAIAIEDERFETHKGVDWKRTGGAVVNMFFGMRNTFGGSTITQQVIKNLTEDNEGTVKRKVTEIFRALVLEQNYSKDDIMEVYLNKVYFGAKAYGVGAAAKTYFGKEPQDLTLAESACIIAITNNPSIYSPLFDNEITRKMGENENGEPIYVTKDTVGWNKYRQELILDKMLELEKITESEYNQAKAEKLVFVGTPEYEALHANDAATAEPVNNTTWSYYVDQVFEDVRQDLMETYGWSSETAVDLLYNAGYTIYANVDMEIQEIAEGVYENVENLNIQNAKGDQLQSGITIIDPYSGKVLATVGGIGEKTGMRMGSYATAIRPCGSAIKPVSVYAPAIENGIITPASVYDDYPVSLNPDQTNGYPKNSPTRYLGLMPIGTAVKRSANTVAVRVLRDLSFASSYDFMVNNLGFGLVSADLDEAPLAMGGLTYGVSTLEMAAAYSAFVNDGIYTEPTTYSKVLDADGNVILENNPESRLAMKETTAYQMNRLLKDVVTSGTGTAAKISGMTVAGKTGTTSNNYDRYFVGYTPYYCAAVWVGYGYNEYIKADGNPAANLWQKVMSQVHEGLENKDFNTPGSGLTKVSVCTVSGLLPSPACTTHSVSVISDLVPTETCAMHQAVEVCTESGMMASDMCPPECRETRNFIVYERENLIIPDGSTATDPVTGEILVTGTPILAEDEPNLLRTVLAGGPCTTHDWFTGEQYYDADGNIVYPDIPYLDENDELVYPQPPFYDADGNMIIDENGDSVDDFPDEPGEPEPEAPGGGSFADWLEGLLH